MGSHPDGGLRKGRQSRSHHDKGDRMNILSHHIHACIKQVQGEQLTNNSLRERFG